MPTRSIAAALAIAIGGWAAPAAAQGFDGTYAATIRCTAFGGDIGAITQQMSLTIAGGEVTGERAVGRPGQIGTGGTIERWTGTVAPDGALSLRSMAPSSNAPIDGSFTGRVTAAGLTLAGKQALGSARAGRRERDCTVAGKR